MKLGRTPLALITLVAVSSVAPLSAQGPPPPIMGPGQLDSLVSRIALYPDPLLAQILAATTYPDDIADAARWADQHHYLTGDRLADAINGDMLPWDPSVQALLPFPSVLDMMASDIGWTRQLGDAFLAQEQDVMDSVQHMRKEARDFGYLRTNGQVVVSGGPYIAISPVNPAYVYVPYYDPGVVFIAPRRGIVISTAIRFGFGVSITAAYRPWGWGLNRFDWGGHAVIINDAPWRRTWSNRVTYVHPYAGVRRIERRPEVRVEERHEVHERDDRERNAARQGKARVEDHKDRGNSRDKGKGKDDRGKDDRR